MPSKTIQRSVLILLWDSLFCLSKILSDDDLDLCCIIYTFPVMFMYFSFIIFSPDQCPKARVLCCNCHVVFLELSFLQRWMCWKQASVISSFMVSVFQVIKDFFPSILALAQTFLHSAHPAVVSFGSCMYKQAFAAFDSYCQQVQCDGWQLFI